MFKMMIVKEHCCFQVFPNVLTKDIHAAFDPVVIGANHNCQTGSSDGSMFLIPHRDSKQFSFLIIEMMICFFFCAMTHL